MSSSNAPIKRYIITAAQNATPVHKNFLSSMLTACKHLKAELIVIPLRYKNPTSRWSGSRANDEVWADEIQSYLCEERKKLNPNLVLVGDVKIQPTASDPLSGFEALTHGESCILGHTKIAFKTIPVPAGKLPKIITSTGACTVRNYTDSKAGAIGAFHHVLGAVMVETKGKSFHLRQIAADEFGSFIDLDKVYTPQGVAQAPPALALSMGDSHVDVIDPKVVKATFGPKGMVEILKPQNLIWHDVWDGMSANPHEAANIFSALAKSKSGKNNIRQEIERTCAFVQNHTPKGTQAVIVNSNHDDFLRRHIVNTDWKSDKDYHNAEFYLETALEMVRGTKMNPSGPSYPSPFGLWANKLIKNTKLKVLHGDESFALKGVEFGLHGDRGPNGSRGSSRNLAKVGCKTTIGHSHSPNIVAGCYQAGTSSYLRLAYNSGPSGWLQTHVVQYASGKRSLISVIDGEWHL